MFYLSNFARPKGAKDKQKRRKRNSLAENLAIASVPTVYSSYLLGQGIQVGEKKYLEGKVKRTKLNINEKAQWSNDRRESYNELKGKRDAFNLSGKELSNTDKTKLRKLEGYQKQTGDLFLSGRELTGLEKNKKQLPMLEKKWNKVKGIPTPNSLKDALIPKLKYLTPTRLGITVLGGAGATMLTGATLKRIRELKEKD
jgi:hypothetical protein